MNFFSHFDSSCVPYLHFPPLSSVWFGCPAEDDLSGQSYCPFGRVSSIETEWCTHLETWKHDCTHKQMTSPPTPQHMGSKVREKSQNISWMLTAPAYLWSHRVWVIHPQRKKPRFTHSRYLLQKTKECSCVYL